MGRRDRARGDGKGAYLDECVDGKNDQLWLCFGIVHEIQIDQFLLLQIVRLLVPSV